MKNLKPIIEKVQVLIEKLSQSLSNEDLACGWREKSQEAMLRLFKRMLNDLKCKTPQIKDEYLTIIRGLDHWGIEDGPLCNLIYSISADLIEYKEKHRNLIFKLLRGCRRQ